MSKRGEVQKVLPFLVCIILLVFVYLSLPVQLTGPTALTIVQPLGPQWVGLTTTFSTSADTPLVLDLNTLTRLA